MDKLRAPAMVIHGGKTLYFCSEDCKAKYLGLKSLSARQEPEPDRPEAPAKPALPAPAKPVAPDRPKAPAKPALPARSPAPG